MSIYIRPNVSSSLRPVQDVFYGRRPILDIYSGNNLIWSRREYVYDGFTYNIASSTRLDTASGGRWTNVDNGSVYMRTDPDWGIRAYEGTKTDGEYRTQSYYTQPFKMHNITASITLADSVTNDRNIGVTIGGMGSGKTMFSLYIESKKLFLSRGSNVYDANNTVIYSASSLPAWSKGDKITLKREWESDSTDLYTILINGSVHKTISYSRNWLVTEDQVNVDQTMNYAGVRSSYHRAYFSYYFATTIRSFEAYTTKAPLDVVSITLGTGYEARDQFRAALTARGLNHQTVTEIPFAIDLVGSGSTQYMFRDCYALRTAPWLDTSRVTNMQDMFSECHSLMHVPKMDTSQVTNMRGMFITCKSLTQVPKMSTSKVVDSAYMFRNCSSLTYVPNMVAFQNKDLYGMFQYCSALTDGNVYLIGRHAQANTTNMISGSGLTREPFIDASGNPI